jgi:hypothetical protein
VRGVTAPAPARRTSPLTLAALLVSLLSLLVAVGATSYAAGLARGSVGTPQLRTGAVTTPKVAAGAVTTPKLRNGAVTGPKVRDRSIGLDDLAPAARPVRATHVERVFEVDQPAVVLASVEGVEVTAGCGSITPSGASIRVGLRPAGSDAPSAPLTGSLVVVRRDQGATEPVISATGASLPFSGYDVTVNAPGVGIGNGVIDGIIEREGAAPVRVEIGLSAIGGAGDLRGCRVRAVLTPVS